MEIIEYRIAVEGDIDAIMSLWQESRMYHEKLDSRLSMVPDAASKVQGYCQEQLSSDSASYVLAIEDQQPIGYISVQLQKGPPVFEYPQIGFIDGLYVKDEYRRRGIGKKLVSLALEWLQDKAIVRIQLTVAALNQGGIDFWKNCGFTELMYRMNMQL